MREPGFHPHPDHVRATYEYLRALPPFKSMKLPDADQIRFRVVRHNSWRGSFDDNPLDITVSSECCRFPYTLMEITAHEMIHLWQHLHGRVTSANHNAQFMGMAKRVARLLGFDPRSLV